MYTFSHVHIDSNNMNDGKKCDILRVWIKVGVGYYNKEDKEMAQLSPFWQV